MNTYKTSLDVIHQFRFIDSAAIGFRVKPVDRAVFRPIGIIIGLIVTDILWGRSFAIYRQGEVNKPLASGKYERLSPTPETVLVTKDSIRDVSIHGWTSRQMGDSGTNVCVVVQLDWTSCADTHKNNLPRD